MFPYAGDGFVGYVKIAKFMKIVIDTRIQMTIAPLMLSEHLLFTVERAFAVKY